MLTTKEKTDAIVAALEDIKGQDIIVINTTKLNSLFDCMIVASAQSTRQTKALADNVEEQLQLRGEVPLGTEGKDSGEWVLVDYGDVVVHIMQPPVRAYYNLEELWGAPDLPRSVAHTRR